MKVKKSARKCSMKKILLINGPNLNMLGKREPEMYGYLTLESLMEQTRLYAKSKSYLLNFKQSNNEGDIVSWIQKSNKEFDAIIINAGALTHTSISLRDALEIFKGPIIEVHLTNIYARETFRRFSYISHVAKGTICGAGGIGYEIAVDAIENFFSEYNS